MSADRHNREIYDNRRAWDRKPVLRAVYDEFYRKIAGGLSPNATGLSVELGSGMGNIKKFLPDCITTDIFPNPWLDREENAYALSFEDESLANLILFDVWHHLEFPANALAEMYRVLAPGGRLIVMEPAMSLTGRFVYGLFHHESLGFDVRFPPEGVTIEDPESLPYFAAQSSRIACSFVEKCQPSCKTGAQLRSNRLLHLPIWHREDSAGANSILHQQ